MRKVACFELMYRVLVSDLAWKGGAVTDPAEVVLEISFTSEKNLAYPHRVGEKNPVSQRSAGEKNPVSQHPAAVKKTNLEKQVSILSSWS